LFNENLVSGFYFYFYFYFAFGRELEKVPTSSQDQESSCHDSSKLISKPIAVLSLNFQSPLNASLHTEKQGGNIAREDVGLLSKSL